LSESDDVASLLPQGSGGPRYHLPWVVYRGAVDTGVDYQTYPRFVLPIRLALEGEKDKVGPTTMKISIAVTTFNGERFVADQLRSFSEQARRPDEVVVCDDESSDRTLEIVNDFGRSSPFPVIVAQNKPRLGIIENFQRAVTLCTGDIIFLSDHDDFWLPKKLEMHEAIFNSDPEIGHVFSNGLICGQDLDPRGDISVPGLGRMDNLLNISARDREISRNTMCSQL
jgi:Glycosyl transferase family 2